MSARISRTLFSFTSIVNRKSAGWEGERAVKESCRKTVVFAHGPATRMARRAPSLPNDLVRLEEEGRGNGEAKLLGGLEVDD
jgi:hypothetical protein